MLRIRHGEEIAIGIIGEARQPLPGIGNVGHAVERIVPELGGEPVRGGQAGQPAHGVIEPPRLVIQGVGGGAESAVAIIGKRCRRLGRDRPLHRDPLPKRVVAGRRHVTEGGLSGRSN